MRILVKNARERTLALEGDTYVLLFRYVHEIDKCAIELVPKDGFVSRGYKSLARHKPLGFLGLISMGKDVFLCVICGRVQVAEPLQGERVNRIYDVDFHCLTRDTWDFVEMGQNGYPVVDSDDSSPGTYPKTEQHPCYELQKLLTDGSFYYSTDFDLTSTVQGRGAKQTQTLSMDRFHLDYMWNAFLMKEIITYRNNLAEEDRTAMDQNRFITTVIRGFAETIKTTLSGRGALLTTISKQSWKRAGTRYNVRGVDDDGNVANFVETETILNDGVHVFSYTQIRGSIPLFWEQDGTTLMNPKVVITRGFDASQPVFEKHFAHLNGKYGPVHIVNLLSQLKSSEVALSREYKQHYTLLKESKPDSVFFTGFDFHQETKNTYADASKVLRDMHESLSNFGYYCYDLRQDETIMEQQGVFRTNCLDCLDRTNVIQQVISKAALDDYLSDFNKQGSNGSVKDKHSVLWADHGDQISQIYTGTNALKSSFSRSGKMGFAGALSDATKSLSRIYINNFVDKGRQQNIDILLGKYDTQAAVQIFDPVTDYLDGRLSQTEPQFTKYEDISIFVGTFNLAGGTTTGDMTEYLFPAEVQAHPPDVFVVGFQEVIELNASSMLKSDGSAGVFWQKAVQRTFDALPLPKYMMLRSEYMSSVLLLMFATEDAMKRITQVEGKYKKTGLGGIAANKGSVAIRFNYGSTSFCFVNSHLAAGATNTEERFNDFQTTLNGLRFSRNRLIEQHDTVIWAGDLNYRVSLPNDQVRQMIAQNRLQDLQKYDQLTYEMKRRPEMKDLLELPIGFNPTYKYDRNSDAYDSSEKQRVPSWTDRILYRSETGLSQLCYHCAQTVRFSDHRPVYATFSARVKIVDKQKKKQLSQQILAEFRSGGTKASGTIELNDDSGEDSPPTWPSSSGPVTPSLIDFEDKSQPLPEKPVLPPRRIPPPQSAIEMTQSSSFSVMQPTRSRSGSAQPPSLPPRELPIQRSPIPPPPPARKVASSASVTSSESKKVPPIVPSKPKELSADPLSQWAPMAPTKKR